MPMTREEKMEKVGRLYTAHKKTEETLEWEPLTWELHPGINIARKWTVITAAYSGLEQTFKYLIAEEQGYTIPELIDYTERQKQDADAREKNNIHTERTTSRFYSRNWKRRRKASYGNFSDDSNRFIPTSTSQAWIGFWKKCPAERGRI